MSATDPVTETAVAGGAAALPWGSRARGAAGQIVGAREFAILLFLIVISLAIGLARPTFFSTGNLLAMGRQMAEIAIMGTAATFLITARELDLSVGSVYGFCSLLMAMLAANQGIDLWIALIVSLLAAASLGLVNGLVTTVGRIPSFIVTLGMLYIVRGAALVMSAYPVARLPHPTFYEVLAGDLFGIPVQIFWMLGIVILGSLVFRRTTFGYWVQATGSNEMAARLAGIPVRRVKIICFILSAVSAAFAGALGFAHLTSVSPTAGTGDELTVIAAVVIGGTSLFGGHGTIIGTFLGAALLTIVRNGLVQLGGEGRLQEAFLGAIIILAVLIHTHVGRRR